MRLLVQIDFEQLATQGSGLPELGILALFVSEDIDRCPPKDKNCFKIICQTATPSAPNMIPLPALKKDENADGSIGTSIATCFLLGNEHPRLAEAQAICAFSANGITYNQARATDDCYSHLVAQNSNWRLLLRLHEKATDYLLMINKDDFVESRFDKAWLVRFKRE